MSLVRKLLLGTGLGLVLGALGFEAVTLLAQQREIARLRQLIAAPPPPAAEAAMLPVNGAATGSRIPSEATPATPADETSAAWFEELRRRIGAIQHFVEQNPLHRIPEFEALRPDDWIAVAALNEAHTEPSCRAATASLRWKAKARVFESIWRRTRELIEANSGELPASRDEIARLLATPLEHQTLARFELVARGNVGDLAEAQPILRESGAALVDPARDQLIVQAWRQQNIQPARSSMTRSTETERRLYDAYLFAATDYQRANGGQRPRQVEDVLPYFSDPKEAAAFLEQYQRTGKFPVR